MADIIELAEGVAAEIGDGAEVMFAPEFDLKGIKEKRIHSCPRGWEVGMGTLSHQALIKDLGCVQ